MLGRSEASLESYFQRLEGKAQVKVVCMDLATHYRSLVRKHFPNANIVADRFHVIRLVNQHFLACWRELLQCGHVIGPVYRTDKHTFPFFFTTPVIWYSGSPMIASDCSKTFLPKTVLSVGSF